MYQIRWHGRGGQGAVTAARMFGLAASVYGESYAQSFPAFGAERRGAPVLAFTKVDSEPILDRSQVYTPDLVVVLDKTLVKVIDVTTGLKPGGKIVINASEVPEELAEKARGVYQVIPVNATRISMEALGRPITNTAMAGAACRASGLVTLLSLEKAIAELTPHGITEKNLEAAEKAFSEVSQLFEGGDRDA
ncbi:MAG: pyruvate ferredoxin oxidoreductase [Firmicutes bacterium]|nr:pyruvate ferredoxin oxidoreductase [Bacillota bacterium]